MQMKAKITLVLLITLISSCQQVGENKYVKAKQEINIKAIRIKSVGPLKSTKGVMLRTILLEKNGELLRPKVISSVLPIGGPPSRWVENYSDQRNIEGTCVLAPMTMWLGKGGHVDLEYQRIEDGDKINIHVLNMEKCKGTKYETYAIDESGTEHFICSGYSKKSCVIDTRQK